MYEECEAKLQCHRTPVICVIEGGGMGHGNLTLRQSMPFNVDFLLLF